MRRVAGISNVAKLEVLAAELKKAKEQLYANNPSIQGDMLALIKTCIAIKADTILDLDRLLLAFGRKYYIAILTPELQFKKIFTLAFVHINNHPTAAAAITTQAEDIYPYLLEHAKQYEQKRKVVAATAAADSTSRIQCAMQQESPTATLRLANALYNAAENITAELWALIMLLIETETKQKDTPFEALATFGKKYSSIILNPDYEFPIVFAYLYKDMRQTTSAKSFDSTFMNIALTTIQGYAERCHENSLHATPPPSADANPETGCEIGLMYRP
jgi:hypothetical protein